MTEPFASRPRARHASRLWLVQVGVVAAVLLASPPSALACSCAQRGVLWAYEQASAVFVGTVAEVKALREAGAGARGPEAMNSYTFNVSRGFKGDLSHAVDVATAPYGAACGYPFRVGETYLVFASESSRGLFTGLCSPNAKEVDAKNILSALQAGGDPADAASEAHKRVADVSLPPMGLGRGSQPAPPSGERDDTQTRSALPGAAAPKGGCGTCRSAGGRRHLASGVLALAFSFVIAVWIVRRRHR